MSWFAPVAIAFLAAAPDIQEVELSADLLVSEPGQQVLTGKSVLRAEGALLRADQIIYRRAEQLAIAKGQVSLVLTTGGLYAAVAEGVTLRLSGRTVKEVFVEKGRVLQKAGVTAEQLFAAQTPLELEALGRNPMTLSGTHLTQVEGATWAVDNLSLSPCDCDRTEPGFRVEAPSARVNLEDRHASMTFPTLYVKSVPVFWMPWLYLPLSNRRTGLLVPRPTFWGQNGFGLDLPLFVTLGRSYDLTFTPGLFSGAPANPATGLEPLDGVKGPRLQTEFRYAPSEGTTGKATLGLLYDLHRPRDPVRRSVAVGEGARGLRAEGSWLHLQELGSGWSNRIDAAFLSDGYYRQDLAADILVREDSYLRSSGALVRRSEGLFAGLEVGLRQDLRWGYGLLSPQGPRTFQKLPTVLIAAPERPLWGPIQGSFRAEYTRLSPLGSLFGDEGKAANEGRPYALLPDGSRVALPTACLSERLFWPGALGAVCPEGLGPLDKAGQADGLFDPGEREARDRLDLFPRLSASFRAGDLARFTPYAAFREDLYLGEVTGKVSHRGYPMAGLLLDTELARVFGTGPGSYRHSIAPSLHLRYVPFLLGEEPAPYDEVDLAIPPGGKMLQASAELRQQLWRRTGQGAAELLRLDLGQGFDLLGQPSRESLRDSWARLSFGAGPLNLVGLVRADPARARIAHASAGFSLQSGGYALFANYDNLFNQGSDQTRRGIDALVGPAALAPELFPADYAEQVVAGFRARFKFGLSLDYSATLARTKLPAAAPSLTLRQHLLSASYGPACDCWRVELHALHGPDLLSWPSVGASLSISGLGTLGSGG